MTHPSPAQIAPSPAQISPSPGENAAPLQRANDGRLPSRNHLAYAEVQIWYNPTPTPRRPNWKAKLRTARDSDFVADDAVLQQYYLHFVAGPRRLRQNLLRANKIDDAAIARFDAWTKAVSIEPTMLLALPEAPMPLAPYQRRGRHRGAYACGQYAVLHLDEAGTAPVAIALYLDEDDVPLLIERIVRPSATVKNGKPRKAGAADFVAYYDPDGLWYGVAQDLKALHLHRRQQRDLRDFHPQSQIGQLVDARLQSLWQAVAALHERLDATERTRTVSAGPGSSDDLRALVTMMMDTVAERLKEQAKQIEDLRGTCTALGLRLAEASR